ncbi:MAG: FlgD immunoglobulin-like domain containing protein [Candidatus Kapaibacterium sp.]
MSPHRITSLLVLLLAVACATLQMSAQTSTILQQPRPLSPAEFMTADTSSTTRPGVPGAGQAESSADQDSSYLKAMLMQITAPTRFAMSVRETSAMLMRQARENSRRTIWDAIDDVMDIPNSIYKPRDKDVVQYQLTLANAMYVPGVLLRPMGTGNMQVSFSDIAKIFGIGEDVSPVIRYVVDEQLAVEIVIYSPQAMIVATLFKGMQEPGTYTLTWNGRAQDGKPVPTGEYIAEVRLGTERIMRKRISWNAR